MNLMAMTGLTLVLTLLPGASGTPAPLTQSTDREGQVHEQKKESVPLARGSMVTVRGLNGSLTIETWEGETAEIDITITASDRDALARRPLLIETTANSLTIRTEERRDMGRDRGWVRHRARLRLPRTISLGVSGINGGVDIAEITGSISVSGVNGHVNVAEAGTATEIKGINGGVSVSLTRVGEQGLGLSGINGGVEIGFSGKVDAQLDVHGVNGGINSDFPLTVVGEMKRGELRGTIGAGGPQISVKGINGGVHIKRM